MRWLIIPFLLSLLACGNLKFKEEIGQHGVFTGSMYVTDEDKVFAEGKISPMKLFGFSSHGIYNVVYVDSYLIQLVENNPDKVWNWLVLVDGIINNDVYITLISEQ